MAPEILQHLDKGTKPNKNTEEKINQSQDIYAAGLILYELNHKIRTTMQKINVFKDLKVTRQLKSQCPLRLKQHIEYDIILALT
jgi:hypothetical protein